MTLTSPNLYPAAYVDPLPNAKPEASANADTSPRHPPRNSYERALVRRAHEANLAEALRAFELAHGAMSVFQERRLKRRRRLIRIGIAVAAVVLGGVAWAMLGGEEPSGNEPIDAVATAEGAGIGVSITSFLPDTPPPSRGACPLPEGAPAPRPAGRPSLDHVENVLPGSPRALGTRMTSTRLTKAAKARVEPDAKRPAATRPAPRAAVKTNTAKTNTASVVVPAAPVEPQPPPTDPTPAETPPEPALLNIGTRIEATLEAPVRTGAAFTPATALVARDVILGNGDRVLLSAGTRLVGRAFATTGDDRVQILWRAVVVDGHTYPLDGETLSTDGSQGLPGKVVKKKGKGVLRRVGAAVLGTAGDALGYGIPGGSGLTGLAEDALAARAGRELQQAVEQRQWLQADKIIELRAGTALVVYLSADVVIIPKATQVSTRQTATVQTTTPQTSAAETATPQTSAPQVTTPQTTTAPTSAAETATPQTIAPQVTTPQTTTPQTSAAETATPQTIAPQATTPPTTTPQTSAPQATTPQTTTPQAMP